MTSCWRDTHPQAAGWNPSEHPGWHQLLDFDGGPLCDGQSRYVVPWSGGVLYCADLSLRAPWCTAYRAQWRRETGITGPLLHVRWVPEADGLLVGLIALALLSRAVSRGTRGYRASSARAR